MSSRSRTVIPGLVKEAYIAGSWHSAPTLELVRSDVHVDGTTVDFEWKAVGSSVYKVTARGSIDVVGWDKSGAPKFDPDSFQADCSCPDGDRQRIATNDSDELYVCKHAKAALDSVLDPEAERNVESLKKVKAAEAKRQEEDRKAYLKAQRKEQDTQLPGERERIEHGLSKRSANEIVDLLKARAETVEGLEALAKVFPEDVMPMKTTTRCGRCKKEYDPQIPSDRICRLEHPYDKVRTEWDGSKKSWSHCRKCDKTFNLDGFHSWGKRRRDDPDDEGEYCFEDRHVPEEEYDEVNDPVVRGLADDDADY